MADNTKDKEMAARMKGSAQSKVVESNGVERFVMKQDAEIRRTMRCPMCHATCSVTGLDNHLRGHMAG